MATMHTWMKAANPDKDFPIPKTTETYAKIRELGLETVLWEEFSEVQSLYSLDEIFRFIRRNKPCLFIYDPKEESVSKGYLFDVKSFSEVTKWIKENSNSIDKYAYLITTQITNPGFGFVGSAYSSGKGNLFCETLHKPGVSNQRELSQSENKQITPYEDFFTIEDGELVSLKGKFLSYSGIVDIKEHFLDKQGYFEFVKGKQKGKVGIYTTGYEPIREEIPFPEIMHGNMNFSDLALRLNAKIAREA